MKAAKIKELFTRLQQDNPNPSTELISTNTYTLLVSVVLSAQATDVSVNKACAPLWKHIKTPADMLDFGLDALTEAIRSIGLYRTKARNVIALSQILIDRHHGKVPGDRASLEALPGVGRKTANVILNIAFGEETCAVDTHIFRLCNRTGLAPGKTPLEVEKKLMKVLPKPFRRHVHHWLILHGRYVCTARSPKCTHCKIQDLCSQGG